MGESIVGFPKDAEKVHAFDLGFVKKSDPSV